jgi:hypothetical protein
VVEDDKGKERVVIGNGKGEPSLSLFGNAGAVFLDIKKVTSGSSSVEGPRLMFVDPENPFAVRIGPNPDGGYSMGLSCGTSLNSVELSCSDKRSGLDISGGTLDENGGSLDNRSVSLYRNSDTAGLLIEGASGPTLSLCDRNNVEVGLRIFSASGRFLQLTHNYVFEERLKQAEQAEQKITDPEEASVVAGTAREAIGPHVSGLAIWDEQKKCIARIPPEYVAPGANRDEAADDKEAAKREIKAGRFIVVDANGTTRAVLGGWAGFIDGAVSKIVGRRELTGPVGLALNNERGTTIASLLASGIGGSLWLARPSGTAFCASIAPDESDPVRSAFYLCDDDGNPGLLMGASSLQLWGNDDKPHVTLAHDRDKVESDLYLGGNSARLAMFDAEGTRRISLLYNNTRGEAAMSLRGSGGGATVQISAKGINPHVSLVDENGTSRVAIGAVPMKDTGTGVEYTTEPSSIVLFGKNGRAIYKAPLSLSP